MEATRSSETSNFNQRTWRHIPEDGILHSHRLENLKSYILILFSHLHLRLSSVSVLLAFPPKS
jgi:hypothetical protein